jgi:hypothetical protein
MVSFVVAQWVASLAKVEVASSRLVSRSRSVREGPRRRAQRAFPLYFGGMAEWSCSGLQSRVRRFDSDSRLTPDYETFRSAGAVSLIISML